MSGYTTTNESGIGGVVQWVDVLVSKAWHIQHKAYLDVYLYGYMNTYLFHIYSEINEKKLFITKVQSETHTIRQTVILDCLLKACACVCVCMLDLLIVFS